MVTAHIGRIWSAGTMRSTSGGQVSKEITPRISPRLMSAENLSFFHFSIVAKFPSRQREWYKLWLGQRTIQKSTTHQSVAENLDSE